MKITAKQRILFSFILVGGAMHAATAMEIGIEASTRQLIKELPGKLETTIQSVGPVVEKIPTKMTLALQLPTIKKQSLFTFLGVIGAIAGIRLIHTGINILTEPPYQDQAQNSPSSSAPGTSHALSNEQLEDIRADIRKRGLTRCSAGLAALVGGVYTIYKFGH